MGFVIPKDAVVIFDLDDTLYKEIDYLKSAYREISRQLEKEAGHDLFDEMLHLYEAGEDVFGTVIQKHGIRTTTKEELLSVYRCHFPKIDLDTQTAEKLDELKTEGISMGLLSDGRSVSQRNKLRSLGIEGYFAEIVISEEFGVSKPDPKGFEYMEQHFPGECYVYIADNVKKDFVAPNQLGWETVCLLDDGSNIHCQQFGDIDDQLQKPKFVIKSMRELTLSSE